MNDIRVQPIMPLFPMTDKKKQEYSKKKNKQDDDGELFQRAIESSNEAYELSQG